MALASSCQTKTISQSAELEGSKYEGWGFELTVPTDLNVKKGGIHDFDTYNFMNGEANILFIYAGFHPSFPKYMPNTVKKKSRRINGKKATGAKWQVGSLNFAEYLIELRPEDSMFKTNDPKPTYLHCIYNELDLESANLAESMINSIHIAETEG